MNIFDESSHIFNSLYDQRPLLKCFEVSSCANSVEREEETGHCLYGKGITGIELIGLGKDCYDHGCKFIL